MAFFVSFDVFFRFLAERCFRMNMKLPQKQALEPKRAVLVPPSPCLLYLHHPAYWPTTSPCQAGKFQGQAG